MAESIRDRDPNAPQNPPRSVLNRGVRRFALWTYLTPLLLFFAGVAVILAYWGTSPPARDGDASEPAAQGTSGTERERSREKTPGGHDPNPAISSPTDEVEYRAGHVITKLGDVFDNDSRDAIGRRVEIRGVIIERVESPTLFWVRDDNARAAVVVPTGDVPVHSGDSMNIVGTVERSGESVRIRASRIAAAK
jgi:hypothetical protein